jgi:hypothetical protein
MPNEQLRDYEIKIIRLVEKLDNITRHCDQIAKRINDDMVTHDKLKVLETEVSGLKEKVNKNEESNSWLMRGLFMAMLSAAGGLIVYLIQKG